MFNFPSMIDMPKTCNIIAYLTNYAGFHGHYPLSVADLALLPQPYNLSGIFVSYKNSVCVLLVHIQRKINSYISFIVH